MECGDLERYLEAFLDGRLSRSRAALLRRHLLGCSACQARVERLRQFERDMQRRFRALEQSTSIWQGLELDLVVSSRAATTSRLLALPRLVSSSPGRERNVAGPGQRRRPRPLSTVQKTGRGKASRWVGIALVAMALGSVYQLMRSSDSPGDDLAAAADAYLELLNETTAPVMRSDDTEKVRRWVANELSAGVPALPSPPGYRLLGADRAMLASGTAGALFYARDRAEQEAPVVLFISPAPEADSTSGSSSVPSLQTADRSGLQEIAWDAGGFRYTAVGRQSPATLRAFAP